MLKVALINPPQSTRYPQPPLGLAMVASVLEKAGYPVSILDANALQIPAEETPAAVSGADVVGITAMTPTINTALSIVQGLHHLNPRPLIILGGAHGSSLPGETLAACPALDIVVRGEGEDTIIELLNAIAKGLPLGQVAGISFREGGKVIHTPPRDPITNVDRLPFPAYDLLPWRRYRPHPPHGRSRPFAAMVTSRGCPYHCAYCSKPVFGSHFRAQSADRVVDEIAYVIDKFGIREIAFYDDSFTLDRRRVLAMTQKIIGSGIKIAWSCETRVNLVDKELLRNMKRAGCYAIAYGIESASPEIIKALHKDITPEQVEKAVRESHEAGLEVTGYFMIGSPGETPETIQRTIEFARRLKLDFAQFSVTTPFPGTELYEIYMKNRNEPVPWENFVYAGTEKPAMPIFESDRLSRQELADWVREAYRRFYLRPAYIWRALNRPVEETGISINGLNLLLRSLKKPGQSSKKPARDSWLKSEIIKKL